MGQSKRNLDILIMYFSEQSSYNFHKNDTLFERNVSNTKNTNKNTSNKLKQHKNNANRVKVILDIFLCIR